MTHTVQPLSRTFVKKAEKFIPAANVSAAIGNAPNGSAVDGGGNAGNIREILSICDSLNTLCEKLGKLDYLLKRKLIESSLNLKNQGGAFLT